MFEIYVEENFSAAHHLKGYSGDCARPHGHNWLVEVYVVTRELDGIGIGIDFRDVKDAVSSVISQFDHTDLNEHPAFKVENPTSENIAKYIYQEISRRLNNDKAAVSKVKVCETLGAGAFYWEE